MPKQIAMTVSRKSSGEQVRATCSSSGGIRRRATSSTATMMAAALPSAQTMSRADPPPPAEHRHEQHHHDDREVLEDQQAEARPGRAALLVSPRSASSFSTIAVELSATEEAGEEPAPPVDAEQQRAGRIVRGAGQHHLQPAAGEDQPA